MAIGNPPWANFTQLPESVRENVKARFLHHDLVTGRRDVLLARSRVYMAALFVEKVGDDHLRFGGHGYFFVLLSLLFNEGAHAHFRPRPGPGNAFAVHDLVEFEPDTAFPGLATRCGLVHLSRQEFQAESIESGTVGRDGWSSRTRCRLSKAGEAWQTGRRPGGRVENDEVQNSRQSINTCGLCELFIYSRPFCGNRRAEKRTRRPRQSGRQIPAAARAPWFVRPRRSRRAEERALPVSQGRQAPWTGRKSPDFTAFQSTSWGTGKPCRFIRGRITRGRWWALRGVGAYRIQAMEGDVGSHGAAEVQGRRPEGVWQGNQAMHAFISSDCGEDAGRISDGLNAVMPGHLRSFRMEGTCIWAKPGRVRQALTNTAGPEPPTLC